jgi:hypothetical protein
MAGREPAGPARGEAADSVPRRELLLGAASAAVLGVAVAPSQAAPAPFCGLFELPDGRGGVRQALPMYVYKLPWSESTVKYAGGETWCVVQRIGLLGFGTPLQPARANLGKGKTSTPLTAALQCTSTQV